MPQWLQNLIDGWPMIRANLPTFFLILVVIVGAVWLVFSFSYGQILASKDAQIQLQDRQITDYKEKLQGATPDQAKARIDDLENRLKRFEPRGLTDEQKRAFIQSARVPAGSGYQVSVTHEGGCPDCPVYSAAFGRLLSDAGWRITGGMVMGPNQRPATGLALMVPNVTDLTVEAATLEGALRAAKIDFELMPGPASPNMPHTQLLITARAF